MCRLLKKYKTPAIALSVYFVLYMTAFTALENFIKPKFIIHCALDDLIPFCRWAVIPYFFWFLWIPVIIFLILKREPEQFSRVYWAMVLGSAAALLIYAVFPNGLHLRTAVTGTDLLSRIVRSLYRIDTSTNVCPSLHVYQSMCICFAVFRCGKLRFLRIFSVFVTIAICISTVLLRQHSVIDVTCGFLLSLCVESILSYIYQRDPDTILAFHRTNTDKHAVYHLH